MSSQKTALVTGGAGFIGSHVCESLLSEGYHVICADNFSTSHPRNIESLLPQDHFHFLKLDINSPIDLESFEELKELKLSFHGIQEIYHLACPMSIERFDQFKIQTLLANSEGTRHVLDVARTYRSRVLLTSSSVVYGPKRAGQGPITENDVGMVDHLSPRSCYDEGRRFAETLCETYRQVYTLDVRIARIFRTYGPRMPLFDGHLIPDFILNGLDGKDVVIFGDKDFSTTLSYVSDVVDGCLRVMRASQYPGPVNLGGQDVYRMEEVAQQIIREVQSASQVTYAPALPFLSELPVPDLTRAKELGWIPLVRLEDGLRKTIEYIRANKMLLTTSL